MSRVTDGKSNCFRIGLLLFAAIGIYCIFIGCPLAVPILIAATLNAMTEL